MSDDRIRERALGVVSPAPTDLVRIVRGGRSAMGPAADLPVPAGAQSQIDDLRASQGSGLPGYETVADLPTLTSEDDGQMAWVGNDSTASNNGAWRWDGTAEEWVQSADLTSELAGEMPQRVRYADGVDTIGVQYPTIAAGGVEILGFDRNARAVTRLSSRTIRALLGDTVPFGMGHAESAPSPSVLAGSLELLGFGKRGDLMFLLGNQAWRQIRARIIADGLSGASSTSDYDTIVYGDSMTSTAMLTGITTELVDSRAVSKLQLGGHDAYGIAVAAGVYPLTVTVSGNSIPASGPVNITAKNRNILNNGGYYTGPFNCTIGDVAGVMSNNGGVVGPITTDQWVFTRDTAGSAVSVAASVKCVLSASGGTSSIPGTSDYLTRTAIIRLGRNGDKSTRDNRKSLTIDPICALCDNLSRRVKHTIIVGPYNQRAVHYSTGLPLEGVGTAAYDELMLLVEEMRAQFGSQFVDMRHWAVNSAIYDAGLTPTSDDLSDMALDCIPRQLFATNDNTHMTTTMQTQEGRFLGRVFKAKGY